jgi:hypothetical protein
MTLICIHNCVSARDSLSLPSRIYNVEIGSRDCLVFSWSWDISLPKKVTVVTSPVRTIVQTVPLLRLLRFVWQCSQVYDIPVIFCTTSRVTVQKSNDAESTVGLRDSDFLYTVDVKNCSREIKRWLKFTIFWESNTVQICSNSQTFRGEVIASILKVKE